MTTPLKIPITQPHKAMLYYPIPTRFTAECDDIYALMAADYETTVTFGINRSLTDTVYVCLQGGDKTFSFEHGGWNRMLRAKDGVVEYTKDEARAVWQKLIESKWLVLARNES